MNVPPAKAMKIVSTSIEVSANSRPAIAPMGVRIENRKTRAATAPREKPVLVKAPPSETASAPLWMTTPAASYPA